MTGLRPRPQDLADGVGAQIKSLAPGNTWTGEAASGFAITPTDPVRTTAKPTLRLVTPPNQRFAQSQIVGVMAFANDGETLIGGVDRVRFHFEGETRDVLTPTPRAMRRKDGSAYLLWAYWVKLTRPAMQRGAANLYIEAIPADATMQNRVLGPYTYAIEDTLHDFDIEVAATPAEITGQRYKTVGAAINYLKGQSAKNPRIRITESGSYLPVESSTQYTYTNWLTIEAADGVTATFARASYIGDAASRIFTYSGPICFRGITFDMRHIASIQEAGTRGVWADRCTFTNSDPEEGYAKWRGAIRPTGFIFEVDPWFTDCHFEFLPNPIGSSGNQGQGGPSLARGCIIEKGSQDVAGDAMCMTGNIVRNWNSGPWLLGEEAFTVTYNGVEATARLSAPIAQGNTRVLTATWGSNSATLTIGRMEADWRADDTGFSPPTDNAYWPRDVVHWINGTGPYAGIGLKDSDSGWSATLLDDTLNAYYLNIARDDPEFSGGANGNASAVNFSVKGVTKTVLVNFDIHADGYQQRFGGVQQNVIIAGEQWAIAGQLLFLAATQEDFDYTVTNNVFQFVLEAAEYIQPESQLGREPKNHVILAHNTWVNQRVLIRYDQNVTLDDYCLIANNVTEAIDYIGSGTTAAGIIVNNHVYTGATAPAGSSGTTIGGDATSLFADAAGGDFSPVGGLLENGRAPVVSYDGRGAARNDIEAPGAMGSGELTATEYVPPLPPPPPPPPSSVIDTSDLTFAVPNGDEVIDAYSFRIAWGAAGRTQAIVGLAPGNYRIRAQGVIYDGGEPSVATFGFQICDNYATRSAITTNGAIDETVSIASGTLRFRPTVSGDGVRFDMLAVEVA